MLFRSRLLVAFPLQPDVAWPAAVVLFAVADAEVQWLPDVICGCPMLPCVRSKSGWASLEGLAACREGQVRRGRAAAQNANVFDGLMYEHAGRQVCG